MNIDSSVEKALSEAGVFDKGAHFIVDGQFGSTGKGLMASVYAEAGRDRISMVTTNAGPNSGHTAYSPVDGSKIVTRQIPVASVVLRQLGEQVCCHLNAGAVIDPDVLEQEMAEFRMGFPYLTVHPNAAVITDLDRKIESGGSTAAIASTGKGVGSAISRKIMRGGNVMQSLVRDKKPLGAMVSSYPPAGYPVILVETAQGFSLGVNQRFYPYCTSRECTVMQAAADAEISWDVIRSVIACYRTYPIRVGNTEQGSSGPCYPDQQETTWEAIGVEPEYTTVTKRLRRVFTWSREQFKESVIANRPTVLFLNFMNYLPDDKWDEFFDMVLSDYEEVSAGTRWENFTPLVLISTGPRNSDVQSPL